jgi:hypothetical protein
MLSQDDGPGNSIMAKEDHKLSLIDRLSPKEQALARLNALRSEYRADSLELRLLSELTLQMAEILHAIDELRGKRRIIDTEDQLVDANYVCERLGCRSPSTAGDVMKSKIGAVRVGPRGGLLRCWKSDVEFYAADPVNYRMRDRSIAGDASPTQQRISRNPHRDAAQ